MGAVVRVSLLWFCLFLFQASVVAEATLLDFCDDPFWLLIKSWCVKAGTPRRHVDSLLRILHMRIPANGDADAKPLTPYSLDQLFQFRSTDVTLLCVCPQCGTVRTIEDCMEVKADNETRIKRCDHVEFPNHKSPRFRAACNAEIVRIVMRSNRTPRVEPVLTMPFYSLIDAIARILLVPGMENELEQWRIAPQPSLPLTSQTPITEIWQGRLWHDFQSFAGKPLLSEPGTIALIFLVDWVNAFNKSNYSVGTVMAAMANLPRRVRMQRKNMILTEVSIIVLHTFRLLVLILLGWLFQVC